MPKLFFALSVIVFIVFAFRLNVRIYAAIKQSRYSRFSRQNWLSEALYSRKLSGSWPVDAVAALASFLLALSLAVFIGGWPGS